MTKHVQLPALGDQLPQRGNRFSTWLGRFLMRVFRWHVEGEICQSRKVLFVMAPHTSWWDFTTNFSVLLAMGINGSWFIDINYTRGIMGRLLRYFGAVQIDRKHHHDMVSHMVAEFHRREQFALAIFPEGTRKPVARWKTGFWYIAKQAEVPVQLIAVDYGKRATIFGPRMILSEDIEKDINTMRDYFRPIQAKRPDHVDWSD